MKYYQIKLKKRTMITWEYNTLGQVLNNSNKAAMAMAMAMVMAQTPKIVVKIQDITQGIMQARIVIIIAVIIRTNTISIRSLTRITNNMQTNTIDKGLINMRERKVYGACLKISRINIGHRIQIKIFIRINLETLMKETRDTKTYITKKKNGSFRNSIIEQKWKSK